MVYSWPGYTGNKACVVRGKYIGALPQVWKDRIMSLRWVERPECLTATQL